MLQAPRPTVRLRLTALYGGLFLLCGAALLAVMYFLVSRQFTSKFFIVSAGFQGASTSVDPPLPVGANVTKSVIAQQAQNQSAAALHQLLLNSGIALAIMAVASIWLGWLVAGRALDPLRTITNAARDISASNLHRRLALAGPDDELKQLANTFDDLLGRLETAFDAQRQFVANASHELRTPLTLERTLVEVALADPDADVESLRATCERVLAAGEQQERLIEALLTLSRSQRGLDEREPFDLAAIAADVLESGDRGVHVESTLYLAPTMGDPRLGERLVANLVDNAARHNVPGGWVDVSTATVGDHAKLRVVNSGPYVPAEDVERLFQPFQRLDRNGDDGGLGLGLSIVQAIATAHGAELLTRARPGGGLEIEVSFPAAA